MRIAAASDLQGAMKELASVFADEHPPYTVQATFGSSGKFYSQLTHRAPFDMFLSADSALTSKLIEQQLAVADSEFLYAEGDLVLWVRTDAEMDLDALGIKALDSPEVRKIAIANPLHAPYGRAAEQALEHFEILDRVRDRLVLGESVSQAAQFVESGAADIGIIAMSLVASPALKDKGRYWVVPLDAFTPLRQSGVTLAWAQDRSAADAFRSFVTGPSGRGILQRFGFRLPGE